MGFFGGSTKVLVASSVYNMAGDIKDRSDYLKTTVVGGIVSHNDFYMGELIPRSYIQGPGIRMRQFARWSRTHLEPSVGIAYGSFNTVGRLDNDAIAQQIPAPAGNTVNVTTADIGFGDFTYWADQWVLANRPDKANGTWQSDYNNGQITITYPDGTSNVITPSGFDVGSLYIYATYTLASAPTLGPYVTGSTTVLAPNEGFPSTAGWTQVSNTNTTHTVDIVTRVHTKITWSDGQPDYEDDWEGGFPTDYVENHSVWRRTDFLGMLPGESTITRRTSYMFQDTVLGPIVQSDPEVTTETEVIEGGVIKTTTRTTVRDVQTFIRSFRIDTQDSKTVAVGSLKIFIYKQGTGNPTLDAMFQTQNTAQRFFPFIPIKLKSWVTGDLYKVCDKAFKKATGGKLSKVVKSLKDNKDINDIQYIYAVFGASLNTPEDTAKEYIFRFFDMMMQTAPPDPLYPTMAQWKAKWYEENRKELAWTDWFNAQRQGQENPLWGKPEPPRAQYPSMPSRSFRIKSSTGMEYDMTILWNMIEQSNHSGEAWAGAKPGKLRILDGGTEKYPIHIQQTDDSGMLWTYTGEQKVEKMILQWQVSQGTWRQMIVHGAKHKNEVYKGKTVNIGCREALQDAEESGFIIPIHEDIYRSMPLVRSTQMSTASNYLVLNSYQKVKKKWYQTGLFQVVIIVVVVVISIFFPPAGAAGGAGVLGANAAVGAALGIAAGTMAAVIVGAIANALAAMLIMAIIQKGATMLLGEKMGAIIGTIASLIAIQVGTAMSTGTSMSSMMGQMMRADNLLKLTSTMGNAVSQYINAGTQDILRQTEDMMQKYNTDMRELQKKYADDFGYGQGTINPLTLTESFGLASESRDSFLNRTLMTGSDIADMSMKMIDNFADTNLQLDF